MADQKADGRREGIAEVVRRANIAVAGIKSPAQRAAAEKPLRAVQKLPPQDSEDCQRGYQNGVTDERRRALENPRDIDHTPTPFMTTRKPAPAAFAPLADNRPSQPRSLRHPTPHATRLYRTDQTASQHSRRSRNSATLLSAFSNSAFSIDFLPELETQTATRGASGNANHHRHRDHRFDPLPHHGSHTHSTRQQTNH